MWASALLTCALAPSASAQQPSASAIPLASSSAAADLSVPSQQVAWTFPAPPLTHKPEVAGLPSRVPAGTADERSAASSLANLSLAAGADPQNTLPQAPSAIGRPLTLTTFPGGVPVYAATPGLLPLTLDAAVDGALHNNAAVVLRLQGELNVRGQILAVENALLPTLTATGYVEAQEINLAAMGFKAQTLASINIPGFNASTFSTIVKVNTADAQLNLSQALTLPALFLYRASLKASEATTDETADTRDGVVLATGGLYLQALADRAQLRNAEALVLEDEVVLRNARAELEAGVGIRLDVLRAQVQLQTEQQAVIRDSNAVSKDTIALNREMGASAGQELELTDSVPFAELTTLSFDDARTLAFGNRKDLQSLQAQLETATEADKAVKYERLPTVGIGGFYGVLGAFGGGPFHGVFTAEGRLQFPIFQEAVFRGQRQISLAQIVGLRHQIDSMRGEIEAELRTSMLDIESSRALVRVARSNQELATEALSDATARFNAGVDDSLPLVRAQAALVGAENQVVQAEFQYNFNKLQFARNLGVVQTQYRAYLGR